MSHDRGCHCGKERYEYNDCTDPGCMKRTKPMVTATEIELLREIEETKIKLNTLLKKNKELEQSDPHKIMAKELHDSICKRHDYEDRCFWSSEIDINNVHDWFGVSHQYWLKKSVELTKLLAEKHMSYDQFKAIISWANKT